MLRINRFSPLRGESLYSYAYRHARMMGFEHIATVMDEVAYELYSANSNYFVDNQKKSILLKEYVEKAAELKKTDGLCLNQFNQMFFDSEQPTDVQQTMVYHKFRTKYCPLCIRETFHHKLIWDIKYVNMCIQHEVCLVEKCPKCEEEIVLDRLMRNKCRCGYKFTEVEEITAEKQQVSIAQEKLVTILEDTMDGVNTKPLTCFIEVGMLVNGLPLLDIAGKSRIVNFSRGNNDYTNAEYMQIADLIFSQLLDLTQFTELKSRLNTLSHNIHQQKRKKRAIERMLEDKEFVKNCAGVKGTETIALNSWEAIEESELSLSEVCELTGLNKRIVELISQEGILIQDISQNDEGCFDKEEVRELLENTIYQSIKIKEPTKDMISFEQICYNTRYISPQFLVKLLKGTLLFKDRFLKEDEQTFKGFYLKRYHYQLLADFLKSSHIKRTGFSINELKKHLHMCRYTILKMIDKGEFSISIGTYPKNNQKYEYIPYAQVQRYLKNR
ncbi:TniQ family protein [Rossellomorea aquimaris]|uniref:TniQ domain-containing protein n=1 Tax=Rossellomorea aquimaris TaxID=189382 RepID=A0A5D4TL65_9BACI|nr:TniQ family protein [Rossellomorea aquimaris]TYS76603.1 hypothetical protein FZC80_14970 [Rossellomorea aquimaris]